ncbi:hypothetical protein Cgig2_007440 [Carnegiea gigantea]|uniref:Uncharacterized protein n=1 Tax=Carnegiea gigantea TaxID=171969 RepID=A0A9Q1KYB6_9CARY|nr:hypothetical protein Cgig2_007440 [Carnegiea gigantea]
MAASTVFQRVRQIGADSFTNSTKFKELIDLNAAIHASSAFPNRLYSSLSSHLRYGSRYTDTKRISQLVQSNGKRLFLVDTLALVRRLEAQGIPSKQAEAITGAITEVLNDSLENVANSFMSKAEMQKFEMIQESNLAKFKSEVQSSQKREMRKMVWWLTEFNWPLAADRLVWWLCHNLVLGAGGVTHDVTASVMLSGVASIGAPSKQGNHFSLLERENEKLQGDIEKLRSELRYEIDKVTAGQRLDLNLERGRIRDELANQNAETTNLTNKLDREIHALRAQLEAAKYDVIKYCIGTLVSISAVGLAVLRILM